MKPYTLGLQDAEGEFFTAADLSGKVERYVELLKYKVRVLQQQRRRQQP